MIKTFIEITARYYVLMVKIELLRILKPVFDKLREENPQAADQFEECLKNTE